MDQKNLFLAIGLSIAIIVVFQFLFPQQTMMPSQTQQNKEEIQFETSIDQDQQIDNTSIKTKEEVLSINNRVIIDATSIKGSINLKGAILDDLILSNYKESLKENSKHINLLSPEQTSNPYYIEIGWKTFSKNNLNIESLAKPRRHQDVHNRRGGSQRRDRGVRPPALRSPRRLQRNLRRIGAGVLQLPPLPPDQGRQVFRRHGDRAPQWLAHGRGPRGKHILLHQSHGGQRGVGIQHAAPERPVSMVESGLLPRQHITHRTSGAGLHVRP